MSRSLVGRMALAALLPVLGVSLLMLRSNHSKQDGPPQPTATVQGDESRHFDTLPEGVEVGRPQKGVGWVFGRLVGVADAPGTSNHAPYTARPRIPPTR